MKEKPTTECISWGWGKHGLLGHGGESNQREPRIISALEGKQPLLVACGWSHTVALLEGGHVYTWGWGLHGQLGHGTDANHDTPVEVKTLSSLGVLSVSCGCCHTAGLTRNGDVFTWGWGINGRLGHGDRQSKNVPVRIEALRNKGVIAVSCGDHHSAAITSNGEVYTWGWAKHGQLGHGNRANCNSPKQVSALKDTKIVAVACGWSHTAALSSEGRVYTWGLADSGQLGISNPSARIVSVPQLVVEGLPQDINSIACGSNHTAAVTRSGRLLTWGSGADFQLGHGDEESRMTPAVVEALSHVHVSEVSCGDHHTGVVTEAGRVLTWGGGQYYQLGHGSENSYRLPVELASLSDFTCTRLSCGAYHTAAILFPGNGDLGGLRSSSEDQIGAPADFPKDAQMLESELATDSPRGEPPTDENPVSFHSPARSAVNGHGPETPFSERLNRTAPPANWGTAKASPSEVLDRVFQSPPRSLAHPQSPDRKSGVNTQLNRLESELAISVNENDELRQECALLRSKLAKVDMTTQQSETIEGELLSKIQALESSLSSERDDKAEVMKLAQVLVQQAQEERAQDADKCRTLTAELESVKQERDVALEALKSAKAVEDTLRADLDSAHMAVKEAQTQGKKLASLTDVDNLEALHAKMIHLEVQNTEIEKVLVEAKSIMSELHSQLSIQDGQPGPQEALKTTLESLSALLETASRTHQDALNTGVNRILQEIQGLKGLEHSVKGFEQNLKQNLENSGLTTENKTLGEEVSSLREENARLIDLSREVLSQNQGLKEEYLDGLARATTDFTQRSKAQQETVVELRAALDQAIVARDEALALARKVVQTSQVDKDLLAILQITALTDVMGKEARLIQDVLARRREGKVPLTDAELEFLNQSSAPQL